MEHEELSIKDVIGLCNWIDRWSWGKNEETGRWNNICNSGGESGIEIEFMINHYMNDYEH